MSLKHKYAFTLVELLVIIAIIGILASMILPALAKAKSSVLKSHCLNNLKQQGISLTAFTTDSSGNKFPPAANGNVSWDDEITDYLSTAQKNKSFLTAADVKDEFFACPADSLVRTQGLTRSYSMNGGDTGGWGSGIGNENGFSVSPSQIPFTSSTILTGERIKNGNSRGAKSHGVLGWVIGGALGSSVHAQYEYFNFSFADGHAEYMHKAIAFLHTNRDKQAPSP
ncbi:MAG: prepilin-type N-terminal cleavage/methylation domain-containing protein [Lentisphaeraceae bacterium]|nr:prepilin-type N-terminal cleavage/methylation domain-containing protein [Lentisphaeraceae bacterium]